MSDDIEQEELLKTRIVEAMEAWESEEGCHIANMNQIARAIAKHLIEAGYSREPRGFDFEATK